MKLSEKLENTEYTKTTTSKEEVINAMKELGMNFNESTKNYFLEFGQMSIKDREFSGLNTDDYLDVVKMTLDEKKYFEDFPKKHFIIENIGIDNLLILVNENGEIYEWTPEGHYKNINNSIEEYILSSL